MEIQKPTTLNSIWAEAGDRVKPEDFKIQVGWEVEIPPYQFENWLTNRQDSAIAHFNQHGIPVWDQYTPYIAEKSYVQGDNGVIYRAVLDNRGENPATGSESWRVAFVDPNDPSSSKLFNGYIIVSSDFSLIPNSRYYSITSTTLTLPANARNGDNVVINKSPSAEVSLIVEGGNEIRTLFGLVDTVVHDITDEINIVWNGTNWQTS